MPAPLAFLLLAPLQAPQVADAALQPEAPTAEQWSFTLEPYYWHAGITGTGQTGNDPPTDIGQNLSFLGGLDGGFLLASEVRPPESRFRLLSDLVIVSLADDEGVLRTETDALVVELGGSYALGEDESWEAIAGVRYVDLDYQWELGGLGGSAHADWLDPWVGVRKTVSLPWEWELGLRGDIGGFGVGSQFSWQGMAVVRAPLGHSARLDLGWRALSVDFDNSTLTYNARVTGLLVGLAFQF